MLTTTREQMDMEIDPRQDRFFLDAEKWCEFDRDDDGIIWVARLFIRHPRYQACSAQVTMSFVDCEIRASGGAERVTVGKMAEIHRIIEDDGLTPPEEIARLAQYICRGTKAARRKGGPVATPDEQKLQIVLGWEKVRGRMTQATYCARVPIDSSTLRRWINELRGKGFIS